MPVSKSQQKAVHKYVKANYDRMELTVPKGRKDEIKAHAATCGQSVNAYVNGAIDDKMARNAPQQAAEGPSRAGVVSLPLDALETAQTAAEAAGEATPQFIARAIDTQAKRDALERRMEGRQ